MTGSLTANLQPDGEFRIPGLLTPGELGSHLAHLTWESLSDFLADGDRQINLAHLGGVRENGIPEVHATEEALIFLMWAHTRGTQLAFAGRGPTEPVRAALDAYHQAVFEDLVENGTPPGYLPLFEQRVGARYAEYHAAAQVSDAAVGETAVSHLTDRRDPPAVLIHGLSERALAVAEPLRDFLEEIELGEDAQASS